MEFCTDRLESSEGRHGGECSSCREPDEIILSSIRKRRNEGISGPDNGKDWIFEWEKERRRLILPRL